MFLLNIFWLLVLIGVMILIHELGHFWAARYFDIKVDVFSFGFGPRLFGFRRGDTDYRFSAILFGGYVKMAGEQPGDENADDPRGFLKRPRWQRLIVAVAGPFMNVVLAVGLLTGLFMVKFQQVKDPEGGSYIGHVAPESAAARAGIHDGDKIVALNGKENPSWEDIFMKEVASAYKPMDLTIERNGQRIYTKVTPALDEKEGAGKAGWEERTQIEVRDVSAGMPAEKAGLQRGDLLIAVNGQPIQSRYTLQEVIRQNVGKPVAIEYSHEGQRHTATIAPVFSNSDGKPRWMIGVGQGQKLTVITTKLNLAAALQESVRYNARTASMIFGLLRGIIERPILAKSLSGPVGISTVARQAAADGPAAFLVLMAAVSVNLAIFNMLPIPILDGGVVLMLVIEIVIGRDLSLPVKETVIKVGFVFLMMVVVFALYNDISKMLPTG